MMLSYMVLLQNISLDGKENIVSAYGQSVYFYLYIVIAFFAIGAVLMMLYILATGHNRVEKEKRIDQLRQRYALFFAEWILQDEDDLSETQFSLLLSDQDTSDPFCRNIIKEQLLQLHNNLLGNEANRLRLYYKALGFQTVAYRQLQSRHKHHVIAALQELQTMHITESYSAVAPLLHHKDPDIAIVALSVAIQISLPNAIQQLHHQQFAISDWQQHLLYDSFAQLKEELLPDFAQYLSHQQTTVVVFALKMIDRFSQSHAISNIISLLEQSNNEAIIMAAIQTLGALGEENSLSLLLNCYEKHQQNQQIRIKIIHQLKELPYLKSVTFLQHHLLHTEDVELQKAIANTLAQLNRHLLITLHNDLPDHRLVLQQIIQAALCTKVA